MRTFDYTRGGVVEEALGAFDGDTRPYAGGTDLLTRMKLGITEPGRLIDIKTLDLPHGIERDGDTVRIGALTTLVEIEHHDFPPALRLLAEAASKAATPQLRERATLGGNLLQRPRCWYYRNRDVDCWLKGGQSCPARDGRNEQHAILGESPCVAVHPSDLAGCLIALDARVTLRGANGDRTLDIGDFFAPPEDGRRHESVIADDELVVSIDVPLSAGQADTGASVYLKAMDRKVWAFALVGVAAVRTANDDGASSLRLAATGVANVPWRLADVEDRLADVDPADTAAVGAAIDAGLSGVRPLSGNAYKVDLLKRLVARAAEELR